jgi:hypothetical protein
VSLKSSANADAKAKARRHRQRLERRHRAAVAVNSVNVTNRATTGTATVNASGLVVESTMRNVSGNTQHLINAEAYAGSSKASDVGVAGALAINLVEHHTEALVGGVVVLSGGPLTLTATSDEKDVAKASGKVEGGGSSVGVGAAVALNIIVPSVVRAEVANGSSTTGTASTIGVNATGTRTVETTAEGGTAGTAITPVVALALVKDDSVVARLGASPAARSSPAAQ